jgi:hypothetical protein
VSFISLRQRILWLAEQAALNKLDQTTKGNSDGSTVWDRPITVLEKYDLFSLLRDDLFLINKTRQTMLIRFCLFNLITNHSVSCQNLVVVFGPWPNTNSKILMAHSCLTGDGTKV